MSEDKPSEEIELYFVDEGEEADSSGAGETAVEVTEPVVDEIEIEVTRLQQEVDRLRELYLRKMADFDNYRKRQERDMVEFRRFAHADLLRDCLPVIDNLERALVAPAGNGGSLQTGVELVLRQFKEILARYGLSEVNPLGEPFDPSFHEAFQRQEMEGVAENTVVQVLQKGYLLGDRLLRPALVVVSTTPATPAGNAARGNDG
jgi:molecular chaperone GrpE